MVARFAGALVALATIACTGCLRPGQDRALSDLEIGFGSAGDVAISTPSAHVRATTVGTDPESVSVTFEMWANHPVVILDLTTPEPATVRLQLDNCMPGSELEFTAGPGTGVLTTPRPTRCVLDLELETGTTALRVAPPDFDQAGPYRFAVMGDIQTGLDRVGDVFATIASDPSVRFVISTGDLVEDNREDEYRDLLDRFAELPVPYFSTIGNHELRHDVERWSEVFGRHTLHFDFKDVAFSLVDSGSATIDPIVYDWLDDWLDDASDRVHVYGQHYPAIDPVGVRQAGMRSRKEAALLLSKLAAGGVDTTFYGHIHSYYAFENAGIPAYISGGGGALPEKLDGIGRHVLMVDVEPTVGILGVTLVRVD